MKIKKMPLTVLLALVVAESLSSFAQSPGTKRWDFTTGGPVYSSPAIGDDGIVYVGSDDKKLYALNPTGTKRWEFATGGVVRSDPSIGPDGTIYVGADDGSLYAVNGDGQKLWTFSTGGAIRTSASIASDGSIMIVSQDKNLYVLNANGSKRWQFATGGSMASASIASDGTIYVGNADGNVYGLNADGSEKWRFSLGANYTPATPAVIESDGTVSFVSHHTINPSLFPLTFFNVTADGAKQFSNLAISQSFSIGANGVRYGGKAAMLVAMNADGSVAWQKALDPNFFGHVTTTPAIASDGTIYVGSDLKLFFAFNPDGTVKWQFTTTGVPRSAPAIGTNGVVYFGADDGKFYAVNGSAPLATTAWPMSGHDAKHTGASPNNILSQTDLALAMYPGMLINGNVGASYRIDYSDDLHTPSQWQVLANVTLDRTPYFFVDVNAANSPRRFYRAVLTP